MRTGRNKFNTYLQFVILMLAALASCTILENGENFAPSDIEPSTSANVYPTLSIKNTASVTPSHTNANTPTSTPTPENLELTPTLPPSEHGQYILDLIASAEGCQLPCIFGITPGKTHYSEVRKLFHPVFPLEAIPVRGIGDRIGVSLYMNETSYENIYIQMEENNDVIEAVIVIVSKFSQNDPFYIKEFAEAMEKYSPENVLRTYGVPTRLYLNLQEPAAGDVIDLLVFYDDLGFFLHYVFLDGIDRDKQTGFLNVCPEYKYLEMINFYLQSGKNKNALEKLEPMIENSLNTWYLPLDELTELSLEDFHRIIVEKENNGCFVSP